LYYRCHQVEGRCDKQVKADLIAGYYSRRGASGLQEKRSVTQKLDERKKIL
jgi:hypothetical protein